MNLVSVKFCYPQHLGGRAPHLTVYRDTVEHMCFTDINMWFWEVHM